MELTDNESFEKAKANVLSELDNKKNEKIGQINNLKIEIDELFIKTFIKYDMGTDFDEEHKKISESIEKLKKQIQTLETYIIRAQNVQL